MKRAEKEQLVTELKDKIGGAQALYYTDFTGLNVKRMTELRRRLRKANVEYVVIKNTLALRAVNESGLVGERLRGPTGLVVARDPVTAAKLLSDFARENEQRPSWARSTACCPCSRARSKRCERRERVALPPRDVDQSLGWRYDTNAADALKG